MNSLQLSDFIIFGILGHSFCHFLYRFWQLWYLFSAVFTLLGSFTQCKAAVKTLLAVFVYYLDIKTLTKYQHNDKYRVYWIIKNP